MTSLPAWCSAPSHPLPSPEDVSKALAALDGGAVTLVGRHGGQATRVARKVVRDWIARGGRAAAVIVDPLTERPDIRLSLGLQAGAWLPGDERSLCEQIDDEGMLVLLDGADHAPDVAQYLVRLAPNARWLFTGRVHVLGVSVKISESGSSKPESATLSIPVRIGSEQDDGEQDGLTVIDGYRCSTYGNWAFEGRESVESEHLDRFVISDSLRFHQIACDLTSEVNPVVLRWLRAAARRGGTSALRVLAAATAARIHLRAYQTQEALELVRTMLSDTTMTGTPAYGLLKWVLGDALLSLGEDNQAHEAHLAALRSFDAPSLRTVRRALALRSADAWVSRGQPQLAWYWLGKARDEVAEEPDPVMLAQILRITGDMSRRSGELVGARALYAEALAVLDRVPSPLPERALSQMGLASIALTEAQDARAGELLELAGKDAYGNSSAESAVSLTRAHRAILRGKYSEARDEVLHALERFRISGSLRGTTQALIMQGDLLAAEGDRIGAMEVWNRALASCVRTRNTVGVTRVLTRVLALEKEGKTNHINEAVQGALQRAEFLSTMSR